MGICSASLLTKPVDPDGPNSCANWVYPLVTTNSLPLNMAIEVVSFPMNHVDFPQICTVNASVKRLQTKEPQEIVVLTLPQVVQWLDIPCSTGTCSIARWVTTRGYILCYTVWYIYIYKCTIMCIFLVWVAFYSIPCLLSSWFWKWLASRLHRMSPRAQLTTVALRTLTPTLDSS